MQVSSRAFQKQEVPYKQHPLQGKPCKLLHEPEPTCCCDTLPVGYGLGDPLIAGPSCRWIVHESSLWVDWVLKHSSGVFLRGKQGSVEDSSRTPAGCQNVMLGPAGAALSAVPSIHNAEQAIRGAGNSHAWQSTSDAEPASSAQARCPPVCAINERKL